MRLLILLILLTSVHVCAQPPTVSEGKVPLWVTQYGYNSTTSDTIETSNGYAYLLISKQNHLELKEQYSE